jgi:hypothetical protein
MDHPILLGRDLDQSLYDIAQEDGGFLEANSGGPAKQIPAENLSLTSNANADSKGFIAKSSVRGNPYPRIGSPPQPHWDFSAGHRIINWAGEVLGIELLPWQRYVLIQGCARVNGRFRYRTVLTIVARQNGKTLLALVRILGGICVLGERYALGTAQTKTIAMSTWYEGRDRLEEAFREGRSKTGITGISRAMGNEHFKVGKAQYRVVASTPGAARGLSGVDLVVMDEIRQLHNWDAYSAIDKTRRARADSQLWAITTEGDLSSEVLNKLQAQGRDSIVQGTDAALGYFEWSASPGAHPGKVQTWAQANPSLGYTLDESTVQAEYETDPSSVFEVEVLCRKVAAIQAWVKPEDFDNCTTDERFPIDGPFVLALDAGPELRHVSIVAGALDGQSLHHVELVAEHSGPEALTAAERRLEALLSRWKPYALVTLHRSPGEASVARLAQAHEVAHVTVRPADWARACRAFYAAVNQRTLRHPGGPAISSALAATKRGPDGLVSSVHRVNADADIDAAVAAVLAMWLPTQQPEPPPVPNWTVF